jgi:hypothetical protein
MERFNKTMSAKGIFRDREKFNFNNVIQRGDVWNNQKRSLLIHSMLADFPIPAIFAQDAENQLHVMDGKQRLTTIIRFLNDEFSLHENTPEFQGKEIAGLKFSELEEEKQDRIKDFSFLIYYFRNMTEKERDEMFLRLNNGKSLSKIELVRVEAGQEFMEYVRELSKNPFFMNCNITDLARAKFTDEEIVLQCILMATEDGVNGLSGSALSETVNIIKQQGLTADEKENIEQTIEFLNVAFVEKVKFLKKVNIPIIFYIALHNRENMNATDFAFAMQEFFKNPSEEYREACSAGSAKAENVAIRVQELEDYLMSKQGNTEQENEVVGTWGEVEDQEGENVA